MVKSSTKAKFLNKNNSSSYKKKKKEESIADKKKTLFLFILPILHAIRVCVTFLLFYFFCLSA
jgi:hypothetical protein